MKVSSSASEPIAIRTWCKYTRVLVFPWPSAMLLGTEFAARRHLRAELEAVDWWERCCQTVRRNCQIHCRLPRFEIAERNDRCDAHGGLAFCSPLADANAQNLPHSIASD